MGLVPTDHLDEIGQRSFTVWIRSFIIIFLFFFSVFFSFVSAVLDLDRACDPLAFFLTVFVNWFEMKVLFVF